MAGGNAHVARTSLKGETDITSPLHAFQHASIESGGVEAEVEPEQVILKSSLHIRKSTGAPREVRAGMETSSGSMQGFSTAGEAPGKNWPSIAVVVPEAMARGH